MAKRILLGVLVAVIAIALPSQANAADRNNDRIPDHWEKSHNLSLKVKQGKRDQDKDGFKNRAEYKADTDPRDEDSDNDGTIDSEESAGKIVSYADGKLTINTFNGGDISGRVSDWTHIYFADKEDSDKEDEHHFRFYHDDYERDGHCDDQDRAGPDDLVEGAIVQQAELKLTSEGLLFTKIILVQ